MSTTTPAIGQAPVLAPVAGRAVPVGRRRLRPYERAGLWATRLFLIAFTIVILIPIAWVFSMSFQKGDIGFLDSIWPNSFSLENYRYVFRETEYSVWVWNTLKVSGTVALIQFFQTATAAYAFSRMRFWGRRYGLMVLLLIQIFPSTMAIASNFVLLAKTHLYDTHLGYILISSGGSGYAIWLLKGYIDGIPRELDEAAAVDGANRWVTFWRIIFPLSTPFLAVQALWTIMGLFSDFIGANVYLRDPHLTVLAVGLKNFIDSQFSAHWPPFAAAAVVTCVPLVIIWLTLQRAMIAGLTRGAVKG